MLFIYFLYSSLGSFNGSEGKESTCNAGDTGVMDLIPEMERSPGGGKWQFTPVFFFFFLLLLFIHSSMLA